MASLTLVSIKILIIVTSFIRIIDWYQSMFNRPFPFNKILSAVPISIDIITNISYRTVRNAFPIFPSKRCLMACFTINCPIRTWVTHIHTLPTISFKTCIVIVEVIPVHLTWTKVPTCRSSWVPSFMQCFVFWAFCAVRKRPSKTILTIFVALWTSSVIWSKITSRVKLILDNICRITLPTHENSIRIIENPLNLHRPWSCNPLTKLWV